MPGHQGYNQKWASGPKKTTQRKEASGMSISQIQASSDGNTHKSKHKLRGGGWDNNPSKSKA